jgi:hypothetical protein
VREASSCASARKRRRGATARHGHKYGIHAFDATYVSNRQRLIPRVGVVEGEAAYVDVPIVAVVRKDVRGTDDGGRAVLGEEDANILEVTGVASAAVHEGEELGKTARLLACRNAACRLDLCDLVVVLAGGCAGRVGESGPQGGARDGPRTIVFVGAEIRVRLTAWNGVSPLADEQSSG